MLQNLCMRQSIHSVVGARRNGYFILGFSAISIVVSIVIFAVGTFQIAEINVEEEAIYKGRNGVVSVEEYGTYSVFVVSDYTCEEAEVSIYEEDEEYDGHLPTFLEPSPPQMNSKFCFYDPLERLVVKQQRLGRLVLKHGDKSNIIW